MQQSSASLRAITHMLGNNAEAGAAAAAAWNAAMFIAGAFRFAYCVSQRHRITLAVHCHAVYTQATTLNMCVF
jgi:hypothetical protein